MNLKRRLDALEQVAAPLEDGRCRVCGYEPGVELEGVVSFAEEPLKGPDVCPVCSRPLILRLEFDRPPNRKQRCSSRTIP